MRLGSSRNFFVGPARINLSFLGFGALNLVLEQVAEHYSIR